MDRSAAKLDRVFVGAFFVQWLACIAIALTTGRDDDLFTAGVVGAAIATVPTALVVWWPGTRATRHSIAVTQMLYGALFVHLTGAKLGTPFHVFASLAFLALYRDWRVVLTASSVVAVHVFAPFATLHVSEIAWVLAMDAFLVASCLRSERDRAAVALQQTVITMKSTTMTRTSAGNVLLAEDNIDTQKIVTEYLERAGLTVTVVENGQRAVDAVAHAASAGQPFDLVLMDMQMPVVDGYAATTELRRSGYGGPIVALTARALPGDRARCINAGCTDYLAKPITRDRLVDAVATHALGSAPTIPPGLVSARHDELLLSDFADDDDMHDLLDGFVTRLGETSARIEAAAATRDRGELERLAHQLRGAAGSYGFQPISDAAEALERASKSAEEPSRHVAALGGLCRRARARSLSRAA